MKPSMWKWLVLGVGALLIARRATATAPPSLVQLPAGSNAPVLERGLASFYGVPFHGRLTASGEVFDMRAMTAAHKTLKFGTLVEVTDVDTGRSVRVRVTDRGPFKPGRIIDLSQAAAEALGTIQKGLASVEIRLI